MCAHAEQMSRKMVPVKAHSSLARYLPRRRSGAISNALPANDQFVPSMNTGTGEPALMSSRGLQLDLVVAGPGRFGDSYRRGHLEVELEAASPLVSLR